MSKGLGCPLCGRRMTAIETHPGRGELYCGNCDLTIGGNEAKTPDELTALIEEGQNAKLRELARDLYDAIDSVFWDGEAETRERFEPLMRELGVAE